MRFYVFLCLLLSIAACACTRPSPQPLSSSEPSVPTEETVQDNPQNNLQDIPQDMNTPSASDYELIPGDARSFLNAPQIDIKLADISRYDNEKVIEIHIRDDKRVIEEEFWAKAKEYADPESGKVKPFTLPIHVIFTIRTKADLNQVQDWFKDLKMMVSTLEFRFAAKTDINIIDTRIILATSPEYHNRIILSSLDSEPADLGTFHIIANADVVQIYNMACSNCASTSIKLEISVSRLFEARNLSINGTKYVKKNQEFLVTPQMILSAHDTPEEGASLLMQNCYFSEHEQSKIISVGDGFGSAYLRNVGFDKNIDMIFGMPIQKTITLDPVMVSNGKVQFRLQGAKPKVDIISGALPDDVFVP